MSTAMSNSERQANWRVRQAQKRREELAHAKRTVEVEARKLSEADLLELANLRRDFEHVKNDNARLYSLVAALKAELAAVTAKVRGGSGKLTGKQLAAMIQRCHPDKWKSKLATEITAVLLDMRKVSESVT
jgi:hypothetical protein